MIIRPGFPLKGGPFFCFVIAHLAGALCLWIVEIKCLALALLHPVWIHELGKKSDICIYKSRVGTYVEEKAGTHVATRSTWIHEFGEKERHMYPQEQSGYMS